VLGLLVMLAAKPERVPVSVRDSSPAPAAAMRASGAMRRFFLGGQGGIVHGGFFRQWDLHGRDPPGHPYDVVPRPVHSARMSGDGQGIRWLRPELLRPFMVFPVSGNELVAPLAPDRNSRPVVPMSIRPAAPGPGLIRLIRTVT